ncbi:FAD-binding oxidoreductase [Pikeienuella sp. HZG-20]|uniref:NAD(P)/FAD-dependent oxidoreductase n=1 Tax=Paludibacillus litoralis TaxID=3133267 RepID=UPI0030EDF37E
MDAPDAIVIGGGVAGISAAAEMAADFRVVVLEAEGAIGTHSTGRSAAIFIRNYGNETLRALNAMAEPLFIEPDGVAESSLLSPRGQMLIAAEDEVGELDAYAAGAEGLDWLSPAEAVELVPILRPERIAAAAIERDARDIDVDRMLQGYAKLLRRRGGRIATGARAGAIRRADGVWEVRTETETFRAPILVNAAGAWADGVAAMAGARPLGVTPMRRSAAIIPAPDGADIWNWPLFGTAAETWYAKPEAGKLMVSPADEDPVEAQDAWPDDLVLAEGLHRYEQAVTAPVTRVERSWAGLRSFTRDRTPAVGFAPDTPGFFWLAGQGGYGVQTAPALARLTAALLKRESTPEPLRRALAPDRLLTA